KKADNPIFTKQRIQDNLFSIFNETNRSHVSSLPWRDHRASRRVRYFLQRFFSFNRSIGSERRLCFAPSGESGQRDRLCAEISLAIVLLLQGPRTTGCGSGVCRFDANSTAPTGLLLRPHRWRVYPTSKRRDRATAKELFYASHRNAHRSRAAAIAYALSAQGGILH